LFIRPTQRSQDGSVVGIARHSIHVQGR
jgi:hypothetical protein